MDSTHSAEGQGITVSYWRSLDALQAWGKNVEHRVAQAVGRTRWYERFRLRVCRVEREDHFDRGA